MAAVQVDQLVADYLQTLDQQLSGIAPLRRAEILDEITQHIADERARLGTESEADVRNLLERIGDPAEIATAARDDVGNAGQGQLEVRRIGPIEVLALVLTPFIWPVGVILLWLSPAWRGYDKLVGTLVPPGGYIPLLLVPATGLFLLGPGSSCGGADGSQSCSGFASQPIWQQDLITVLLVAVVALLLVLPLLTALYLTWRLRKWSAQQI